MDKDSFFNTLEKQYQNRLPFVVYSRPINSIIKCWLQKDTNLHTTTNFTESGFIFSPFNLENKSVLLPQNLCDHYSLEIDEIEADEPDGEISPISNSNKIEHLELVSNGIETIKNKHLKKVVLSRVEAKSQNPVNPIALFKRLFSAYKNAMVYCWYHPKVGLWLGATPELLFKVEGKQLTTISLAGTQIFNGDNSVKWSDKEIEEQQIVTDYIKNQIKPYTQNINITDVETVKAGNLMHLKTRIISRLSNNANLKDIIEALHPTPAVCGFPKQEAKTFILQNENYNREFYTGFLGELNLKQTRTRNNNRRNVENNAYSVVKTQSNFYVNLRCVQLKNDKALIYVGGGITKSSVAENEWEETVNKTKTIRNVLN